MNRAGSQSAWILAVALTLIACHAQPVSERASPPLDETALQAPATQLAQASQDITAELPPPDKLRPCCTFGHHLKVRAFGIPVPLFRIDNLIEPTATGSHHYNNGSAGYIDDLLHLDSERLGILYTHRGGFIDLAHLRDTADNQLFLFSWIWPRLGQAQHLQLRDELAGRRIELLAFTPPSDFVERYELTALLATRLAFQLAVWHEIAQWYGYRSVWFFAEDSSAFSPEDLYSNALGARLGLLALLHGNATSAEAYSAALTQFIPQALQLLGTTSAQQTGKMMDRLDGCWWNSKARLPDKFALLMRSYDTGAQRLPMRPATEAAAPLPLTIPERWRDLPLDQLAQLRLMPHGSVNGRLPAVPERGYWDTSDFAALAGTAAQIDAQQLAVLPSADAAHCQAPESAPAAAR